MFLEVNREKCCTEIVAKRISPVPTLTRGYRSRVPRDEFPVLVVAVQIKRVRGIRVRQAFVGGGGCGGCRRAIECIGPHSPIIIGNHSAARYGAGAGTGVGSDGRIKPVES